MQESVLYQHFCLGENCPSKNFPEARQLSSFLYVPGALPAAAPAVELNLNESISE